MAIGIHLWSQTQANNATADASINWAEGQSPGSVNDSARQMMARIADWLKDLAGITSGGTATAYTVTTNRAFASAAVMDGAIICIRPNADSGASPTLAVDGLTARAINYSTGVAVPAGALKSGTPYFVVYVHASTEFILLGAPGALSPLVGTTPVGGIMDFAGSSAPTGWLLCDGASYLRSDKPALFAVIGTTYGAADGTHFNTPPCGGRVTAGKEASATLLTSAGSGVDGGTLGAVGGAQTVTLDTTMIPSHTHTASVTDAGHTHALNGFLASSHTGSQGLSGGNVDGVQLSQATNSNTTGITVANSNTGGGLAHANTQPTIVLNKIIFAGV